MLPDCHELAVLVRAQDELAPFQRLVHDGFEVLERSREAHRTAARLRVQKRFVHLAKLVFSSALGESPSESSQWVQRNTVAVRALRPRCPEAGDAPLEGFCERPARALESRAFQLKNHKG